MARSWSGFLPQNEDIKEQWGVLEETQAQIGRRLQRLNEEKALKVDEEDDDGSLDIPIEEAA